MISEAMAREIAQAHIDRTMMAPRKELDHDTGRLVTRTPTDPIKVWRLYPASFGYTATYNTVPATLGGNRPLYVAADGSEVRTATWREIWEADPNAYLSVRPMKDELIAKEEAWMAEETAKNKAKQT